VERAAANPVSGESMRSCSSSRLACFTNFVKNNEDGIPESVPQGQYGTENEEDSRIKEFSDYLRDRYAAAKAQGANDSPTARREEESRIALEYAKENRTESKKLIQIDFEISKQSTSGSKRSQNEIGSRMAEKA
jgi:hypothetical protein